MNSATLGVKLRDISSGDDHWFEARRLSLAEISAQRKVGRKKTGFASPVFLRSNATSFKGAVFLLT